MEISSTTPDVHGFIDLVLVSFPWLFFVFYFQTLEIFFNWSLILIVFFSCFFCHLKHSRKPNHWNQHLRVSLLNQLLTMS